MKRHNWLLNHENKFEMRTIESLLLIKYAPDQVGLENAENLERKLPKDLCFQFNMYLRKEADVFEFKRRINKFS